MATHELIIPKTGLNLEDCYLLDWIAPEGTKIAEGEPVFQMEIEKTVMEIETDDSGWLHHLISPSSDTPLPIATVIGLIAETEEEYQALLEG